ncbi:hypothetical protein R69619_02727 [Paraburkholderia nemoris]|uniref:major capsid protein P2 n=1 Tax=Paraburkholderia nemoris TaxID=2793076 RepID=UPI001909F1DC|nr:major capsid protein P2 [Paraburkholderia nemoris]MBK3741175.1 hypothetical protein [Paraburkholderia aspalathi]CAE6746611.1 hypothetical protein R69619_02727 [Paraburkholderia nemoris]
MRIQQQTNITPYQPGGTVIVNFPLGVTYEQIKVQLTGGLTCEMIPQARLKVNGKAVWTVAGADLKNENLYDGKTNDDFTFWLDFTQQNAKSSSANGKPTSQAAEMLVACYPSNLFQSFTLEIDIASAAAGAPAAGTGGVVVYTTENDPSGNQYVLKQLFANYSFQTAQNNDIALPVGGSGGIIKQIFYHQTNYAPAWVKSTAYAVGALVSAGGNTYQCATAGTSASSGSGPTGTGSGIADGTAVWNYLYGTGSVSNIQVFNQGVIILQATPAQLAAVQTQYGKVQEAGLLVLDFYLQGLREKLLNTTKSNNVFVRLTTVGGPVNLTGYTRLLDPAGR